MECYEGATMIKTFRGLIVDGGQDTIALHTNDGSTGYRIVKFQLMAASPAAVTQESIGKIYKVEQTTIDGTVDFSDNTLLASGLYILSDNSNQIWNTTETVIFDNEIFNQDIYVTHKDVGAIANASINYYIELEQIKLDLSESTVATLKDIRNETRIPPG
jgi:hypothetical protein